MSFGLFATLLVSVMMLIFGLMACASMWCISKEAEARLEWREKCEREIERKEREKERRLKSLKALRAIMVLDEDFYGEFWVMPNQERKSFTMQRLIKHSDQRPQIILEMHNDDFGSEVFAVRYMAIRDFIHLAKKNMSGD